MLTLYPHQIKATEATFEYFEKNNGMPLIVAPVGSGKSLLIAEFIKRAGNQYPETRFIVLSHVTELLVQDSEHLLLQNPKANISFYAQKLGKKAFSGHTIFASINSVYKKAYKIPHAIDLVIIDEAHLISPNSQTMYQSFIKDLKIINPYVKIIGYTGTNFRATEGKLTEGAGRLFTDVAYQIPMLYLIEKNFLCPLVTPAVKTIMSLQGVKSRNGDYIESQLQAAVDKDEITKACVDEIIHHGETRKKWLVFAAGATHCKHVLEEIRSRGISAEMVLGTTPTKERERIVALFKTGDLRCLVNVGCFTTGFNNPAIDLMAFMRPTRSPVLYVQMGGRGMRTAPGKVDCCLLDFGGVIADLGPIDLIDAQRVNTKGATPGDAPIKVCPKCDAVCFCGVNECQDCGYEFPISTLDLSKKPSTLGVLSNQIIPEWHDVISVSYSLHKKEGKQPSLRVTYNTLDGPFREWICYEHAGFALQKAVKWHLRRSDTPIPKTIVDALKIDFREPSRIQTRQVGKFHELVGFDFEIVEKVYKEPTCNYFRVMEGLDPIERLADAEDIPF